MKIQDYNRLFDMWLNQNHGKETFLEFIKLESIDRKKVMDFILNSHLHLEKNIGDKKVFFVHAIPPSSPDMMKELIENNYTLGEAIHKNRYFLLKRVLEERNDKNFDLTKQSGHFVICGHSPVDELVHKQDSHIMIDSACGHKWYDKGLPKEGRLALYCIEDDKVVYFPQKEDIDIEKIKSKGKEEI